MQVTRNQGNSNGTPPHWHELLNSDGALREHYAALMEKMRGAGPGQLRILEDRIEASLREMGVSFDVRHDLAWRKKPWHCDILPLVFTAEEWSTIRRGVCQRLQAFECFLSDIYGPRRILRDGVIPVPVVLGSPYFEAPVPAIDIAGKARLHVSGLCIARDATGGFVVRNHYFSHASGISYMIQNRRAMARVNPDIFRTLPVEPIADIPVAMLERIRRISAGTSDEPGVVLLSPGPDSAAYPEHSLLARRMGIPLVQGGDLLVLDDKVFLKTIAGLVRVDAIYTRVADPWIDPLVFLKHSTLGVPGLVHCVRRGSVTLINALGSQLADDRALLPYASAIIRYYLGESAVLRTERTRWLGDMDERAHVLENLADYQVRPLYGERVLGRTRQGGPSRTAVQQATREVLQAPGQFVAQRAVTSSFTTVIERGREVNASFDHIVFALRDGEDYEILPGALTRVAPPQSLLTASELGGGSKDTWVLKSGTHRAPSVLPHTLREFTAPAKEITSRMAENFYWLGRYLERAYSLTYMISGIETLETEELNAEERRLYRPMWNKLLPPLDGTRSSSRSISSWQDRYRLVTNSDEPGTAVRIITSALRNAQSVQDLLSPEVWAVLEELEETYKKTRFLKSPGRARGSSISRRLAETTIRLVPQAIATAQATMLDDDAMRFFRIGLFFERAAITSNAVDSISSALIQQGGTGTAGSSEIELSAFLRLLGSRDAYRRIYQMRASPAEVLSILCQNGENPRSLAYCIGRCLQLLADSLPAESKSLQSSMIPFRQLLEKLEDIEWQYFFQVESGKSDPALPPWLFPWKLESRRKMQICRELLSRIHSDTLQLHEKISDGFLNHQFQIEMNAEPMLSGFSS